MKDLFTLLIIGILVVLKLIITGICLAIGFKVGYMIMDKVEKRNVRPETAVA